MSVDFRQKRIVLDEPARKFLQSLKAMREDAGLSKAVLAEAIGIARTNLTNYENGKRLPSLEVLIKLAEFFRYNLSESLNYKLYNGEISPAWLCCQLKRYGFNYAELSRMTGYSLYSVRNCFVFSRRITPQCLYAVLEVLEQERQAYNFSVTLLRRGMKYKHED